MAKRLTKDEEDEIIELLRAGVSQKVIALQYGIDQSTVSKLLKTVVERAQENPYTAGSKRRRLQ